MNSNSSPLDYLAAFGIVAAASVLATVCLGKYIDKIRRAADLGRSAAGPASPTGKQT